MSFPILAALAVAAVQAVPAVPDASEALRFDRKGRPVTGVTIDGKGPFDMVVDTAAQVTLIAPDLAKELALPDLRSDVTVQGATGPSMATMYGVGRLNNALFDRRDVALPAFTNSAITDARGIVGIDMIAGRKLLFDRANARIAVTPSCPAAPGYATIRGRIDPAGMVVIPMTVNGRGIEALVDSGAEGIIAGPGLIDLLGWAADDPRIKPYGTVGGAGGNGQAARWFAAESLQMGPVKLGNVPIVIPGGATGGQEEGPVLILGVNVLNLLGAYAVDFTRGELQIRMPERPATGGPAPK